MVAAGGALGAVARLGVGHLAIAVLGVRVPWHTFAVNIIGCFALGVLTSLSGRLFISQDFAQFFLAVGFLGAFTTFSTFEMEAWSLMQNGRASLAMLYIMSSVVVGLLAAAGGIWLGRLALP